MRYLALLLLFPALAQAQMYRWVDDSGKVHYSDQAPASGAKKLEKRAVPARQDSPAGLPYALQQAIGNFPVALYTSEACKEACARARELLDKRGIPYSEVTVADEADLAQLKKLSGDQAVPVMTVGRVLYKGFESGVYTTALDNAGYPSSSLLPPGVAARRPVAKAPPKPAEAKPEAAPPEAAEPAAPK